MEVKKIRKGNLELRIYQEECPLSPDDCGNEDVFLVSEHRDFTVRRKGFDPINIHYNSEEYTNWHIYPVYAYIHSGVVLSLGNTTYPFTDKWDVSTVGFVLVNKDYCITDCTDYAENLIKEWNMYLSGDIYCMHIVKLIECPTCKHVEEVTIHNCGGYYGKEGIEQIESEFEEYCKKYE